MSVAATNRKGARILVASDIHGNFEALKALPRDYDELWVLGDLVNYGPQPREVIEFVHDNASLVVRGNHDDAVAFRRDARCSAAFRRVAEETHAFTESVLTREHKEYLADLPHYRWVRRGEWTFYACHAAPSDPLYVYRAPDDAAWSEEVTKAGCDFLLVGHTHIPFCTKIGEQCVLNPGSVGQPKSGSPGARFAIWENGIVSLECREYPVAKTVALLRSMSVSESTKEFLVQVLESGTVPKSTRERVHVKNQRA